MKLTRPVATMLGTAAALLLAAGPAVAATPYTVKVGAIASGDHPFTTSSTFGPNFDSALVQWSCSSDTFTGVTHAGTHNAGDEFATVTDSQWIGCLWPLGFPMTYVHQGEWKMNLSGDATPADSDRVPGSISDIRLYVHQSDSEYACNFQITGTVDVIFDEATQRLEITEPTDVGDLRVSDVEGCYRLITDNEELTYTDVLRVTSPDGPITVE